MYIHINDMGIQELYIDFVGGMQRSQSKLALPRLPKHTTTASLINPTASRATVSLFMDERLQKPGGSNTDQHAANEAP